MKFEMVDFLFTNVYGGAAQGLAKDCADRANKKLTEIEAAIREDERKRIMERAVKVYRASKGSGFGSHEVWSQYKPSSLAHGHSALLIEIKPLGADRSLGEGQGE